jgi:hypothetical protein
MDSSTTRPGKRGVLSGAGVGRAAMGSDDTTAAALQLADLKFIQLALYDPLIVAKMAGMVKP